MANFLGRLWDTLKGAAPAVAGAAGTMLTGGNPLIGGLVAKTVRGLIGGDSNDESPLSEGEAEMIINSPDLYMKFKLSLAELEMEAIREDTKRLQAVNETMRAESKSESFAQRTWRPFNGYLFGITLFFDYIGSQLVLAISNSTFNWEHIDPGVYMLWTTVLGVAAGTRGWEKVSKAKANGEVSSIKDTVKTFGAGFIGR